MVIWMSHWPRDRLMGSPHHRLKGQCYGDEHRGHAQSLRMPPTLPLSENSRDNVVKPEHIKDGWLVRDCSIHGARAYKGCLCSKEMLLIERGTGVKLPSEILKAWENVYCETSTAKIIRI